MNIPEISDYKLKKIGLSIRPVYNDNGKLRFMQPTPPKNYRNISYIWSINPDKLAGKLQKLTEIRTLHTYGYHGFFKPSLAEVYAQIPEEYLATAVAFEIFGPENADDLNREKTALDAGFHVANVVLYSR